MSGYTKGPWRAGRADMGTIVDGVESKWIYDERDQYVAVASGRIDGEWAEVMANAHLIAAAPQLLEALKDQRDLMVGYKSRLECDRAYVAARQVSDRIEMVTAIIAKAEGK